MFVAKGFISHAQYLSNVNGVVAPIGELSTQALTYAREKGYYRSATDNDLSLTTFITKDDTTTVQLVTQTVDHVVGIAKFIYTRSIAAAEEIFADELLIDLIAQFSATAENFACGEITDNGSIWMPEWISWKAKNLTGIDVDNNFRIWFSDEAFRLQYDSFEIYPVAPTDTLNDFFKTPAEVQTMIDAVTPSENSIRIQTAKEGHPESVLRSETFDYVSPLNPNYKIPVTFTTLIHGEAGNNIDSVTDAIVEFILANSTHTREEWLVLFPDLFRRTEFILLPLWDQFAIPNRIAMEAGIYSPITNLKRALALIKQYVVDYPEAHINDYTELMGTPYKSLSILTIGSPDNRDDLFQITDVFPDYLQAFSTSLDFNRMSNKTKNWVTMLASMLIVAETMESFTGIPPGMTKMTRDDVLYVVKRYENINYLIAAKTNFPDEVVE